MSSDDPPSSLLALHLLSQLVSFIRLKWIEKVSTSLRLFHILANVSLFFFYFFDGGVGCYLLDQHKVVHVCKIHYVSRTTFTCCFIYFVF